MTELLSWARGHGHAWAPLLLLAGVVANGMLFSKRWPNIGQCMHLLACVASLFGAAHVWADAAVRPDDASSWGQMLGAFAILFITVESGFKVLRELSMRGPTPPSSGP